MIEADVEGSDGMAEPEMMQVRKRYFRPLLRVGSTGLAITVTGLTYDPVQSTPAPEGATAGGARLALLGGQPVGG